MTDGARSEMEEELFGAITGGLGLIVVGLACWWIARAHEGGQLERNGLIGVRTRSTLSSDAAWRAGHDAATPWMRAAGVLGVVSGPVVIVLGALGAIAAHLVVLFGGYAVVLVLAVVGTVVADRAARRARG